VVQSNYQVVVSEANTAPALTGIPAFLANGTEDAVYTLLDSDLLQGFSDVDGDILSVINLQATNGILTSNQDGTYSFMPDTNFNGMVELSYQVIDGNGGIVDGVQSFVIDAVNSAPVANPDSAYIDALEYSVTVDVLANDTDAEGDLLDVVSVSSDGGADVVINEDNSLTISTSIPGWHRVDYQIADSYGNVSSSFVDVLKGTTIEAPTAYDASISVTDNSGLVSGYVDATDSAGNLMNYRLVSELSEGLTLLNDGMFVFELSAADRLLNDGESRTVSFDFVSNNGFFDSNQATVTITINGVTDEGSVLGADGGDTVIIRNQDGTTTHTHSNDGTGNDWQQTINSVGQLITQTDSDQENTESWTTRVDTFDNNGSRVNVTLFNDDGSRDELLIDASNLQSWSQISYHYNMSNQLDYVVTMNDDGSTDWQDEDQDNNQSWTTVNSHQTATGALDWRRYVNDDGTQEWLDVDQDNSQAWANQTTRQNTLGEDVVRTVVWDDGAVDVMQFIPDALDVWQQNTQHFDKFGSYTGSDVLLGIPANQVWLRQEGNNLEVSQIGTDNKMLIADWFNGNAKTNFSIDGASGSLMANEVQALVDAMAVFTPPTAGQTGLPQNYQDALGTLIAASWS
ncbi:MAG: cadherin-like domain-containing protein, partial [Pseudomonadales bacterium]|nr:cadherin-like domain-containing protein [Pseudomonadales bacterium]